MAVSAFAARHILAPKPAGPAVPPVLGYLAWYDASAITGQADNTPLSAWPDSSGNGHNLAQATGTKQPTYYSTTSAKLVNGKPAVWFNGAQVMASTGSVLPQTIFCVAKYTPGTTQSMVGPATGTGTLFAFTPANQIMLVDSGTVILATGTGLVPTSGASTVGYTYQGTTANFYINSGLLDSTFSITHTMPSAVLGLGADEGIQNWMNGAICEVVVYPTVLNGTDIASTYTYLKTKWGTP